MEIIHNWGFLALKVDSQDMSLSRDQILSKLSQHAFMKGLLEDPTLKSSCALINGELVMSKLHLGVAVMRLRQVLQHAKLQALLNVDLGSTPKEPATTTTTTPTENAPKRLPLTSLVGNLRTTSLPSEMLLMFYHSRNISAAMKHFSFIEKLPVDATEESQEKVADVNKRKPVMANDDNNLARSVVFILGMYKPPQHVISHLLEEKVRPFLRDPQVGKKRDRDSPDSLHIEVLSLSDLPKYCNKTAIRSVYQITPKEERAVAIRPQPEEFEVELLQRFASVSPVSSHGAFPSAVPKASPQPHITGLEGAVLNRIASCDV